MSHHERARLLTVFVVASALTSCAERAPEAAQAPATLAQFQNLRFLEGSWRGSGGAYAAFYEEYRAIDDSTIGMRSFSDSTFQTANDSSTIEFRNGVVANSSGSVAIALTDTSVQFRKPPATRGGFTFTRNSADQWTATLHPAAEGRTETVYIMKRVQR